MKPAGKEKNGPVEEKLPQTYWGGGRGNLVVNSMKISNEVPEERRQKML